MGTWIDLYYIKIIIVFIVFVLYLLIPFYSSQGAAFAAALVTENFDCLMRTATTATESALSLCPPFQGPSTGWGSEGGVVSSRL